MNLLLRALVLRRTKAVLALPAHVVEIVQVPFINEERHMYNWLFEQVAKRTQERTNRLRLGLLSSIMLS